VRGGAALSRESGRLRESGNRAKGGRGCFFPPLFYRQEIMAAFPSPTLPPPVAARLITGAALAALLVAAPASAESVELRCKIIGPAAHCWGALQVMLDEATRHVRS
jgi:hypothetical protein